MAGLDFHVLSTLVFRGWTILAGLGTLVLLPLRLGPTQQGYYYTFSSILAMQVFFELGLNQIISQLVSHEMAHLKFGSDGSFEGETRHLDRLASIARMIRQWYGVAALLFAVAACTAGIVFFAHKDELPTSEWIWAWLVLVAATACNLYLSPGLAMMEGAGRVGNVARLRLLQSCVGYIGLWALLLSGAGLWSATATSLASVAGSAWWLRSHGDVLRRFATRTPGHEYAVSWRRDIFPLQWRIAVSWISGYFIFNLFTPLTFSYAGAVEAGRLGLALTAFSAVSTIGMSWVSARSPQFTMHIARNEREALDTLFRAILLRSTMATLILCCGVLGVAWALKAAGAPGAERIASPGVLVLLAVVTACNSVIFAAAAYMRAHREEPMLPISVVAGILTAIAAFFGIRAGTGTMIALYAGITATISLPWTLALLQRYMKRTS